MIAAVSTSLVIIAGALPGQPAEVPPPRDAQDVSIPARDGLALRATYRPSREKAAAVLLLHQCSGADRRDYAVLAGAFQASGLSALALDFRGFGDSRDDRYRSFRDDTEAIEALWPDDVERVYAWLAARPEVDGARLAVVGSSCGNAQAVYLARNHPEIQALVVLSGSFDPSAEEASAAIADRPLFVIYSEQDGYGTPESMSKLARRARSPFSKTKTYPGRLHGVALLRHDEGLAGEIVRWTAERLARRPRTR